MRRLGDVPGLDELPSAAPILKPTFTYTEVDPIGEVTADNSDIGDALLDGDDPFAYRAGFLDEPEDDGSGMGGGYTAQYDPMQSSYLPTYSSGDTGTQWDQEQLDNARIIAEVGKKVGATDRDVQTALMAAIVESGLHNVNYGDRDSLGLFQQRDAWGSAEERMTPATAAELFFRGGRGGQQGLLDIKNREGRSMGELAQDVQVSAFPERYAQHESEAAALMGAVTGSQTYGTNGNNPYGLTQVDGETIDNITAAALAAASKEFGSGFRIMQGSHTSDYGPSGGTHAGGGVVDLAVPNGDWVGAMTALRKIGFAAWVRNVPGYGQAGEGAHIHAVLIGNKELSPEAQTQVQSYFNNDDGLAGSRADDGPRQFVNNVFKWGKRPKTDAQDPTWRDAVTKTAHSYVGTPFKWGGKDHSGIDSDTLLQNVYKGIGIDLPDLTTDLKHLAGPMEIADAKPADLIGWHDPIEGIRFGVYLGHGSIIEAGGPGRVVQLNDISNMMNVFGVPIMRLIKDKPYKSPFSAPAPASSGAVVPSPSKPHAPIPGAEYSGSSGSSGGGGGHPSPHGPLTPGQGALNPNHPHVPLPGEY